MTLSRSSKLDDTISISDIRHFANYAQKLQDTISDVAWENVAKLTSGLRSIWKNDAQIFICGNGGSAANATHIANDLLFGVTYGQYAGIKAHALSSNQSVVTCIANDTGYENVYSHQLETYANEKDILLVLSGSGNSENIINAIKTADELGMKTYAILGFDGGKCKSMVDSAIHIDIDDMQIAEDIQIVIAHMVTQALRQNQIAKPKTNQM